MKSFESMSLNELRDHALRIANEHGFKDASVPEDIALMHSELSEALEDYRANRGVNEVWYEEKIGSVTRVYKDDEECAILMKPCGIPSEMADIMIRVLHFCGKHGIDIESIVSKKMAFNQSRPYKHGNKKI
jgi:NTP pyrophosphatase (non-canonical NTP hydrolase)